MDRLACLLGVTRGLSALFGGRLSAASATGCPVRGLMGSGAGGSCGGPVVMKWRGGFQDFPQVAIIMSEYRLEITDAVHRSGRLILSQPGLHLAIAAVGGPELLPFSELSADEQQMLVFLGEEVG